MNICFQYRMLQLGNDAHSRINILINFRFQRRRFSIRHIFSFSEFWSFEADDRSIIEMSAISRDHQQIFKDICDSDDYSIFFSNVGADVEEANLPDILEY